MDGDGPGEWSIQVLRLEPMVLQREKKISRTDRIHVQAIYGRQRGWKDELERVHTVRRSSLSTIQGINMGCVCCMDHSWDHADHPMVLDGTKKKGWRRHGHWPKGR